MKGDSWRYRRRSEDEVERARRLVELGTIKPREACTSKQVYYNKNDARHAAKEMAHRHDRIFDTYRCPFCRNWHITKRPYGEEDYAA